ncbi:hydroxypyruvate isomerase [Neorhizobium alkalisoli]|uniref:Hydroxypyruvate isomerase n=2 Tax=Neorhizobium alkalisoli TaxID=528178 RepID=A0A561R974_9HYPH|nr:hydroxypyruvate isomerase [Neorhizobium alkalisoli]
MSRSTTDFRSRMTANIAFMFADLPFIDRIPAAAAAGFKFVECHFPYDIPVDRLLAALNAAGVQMTGINTAPGNLERGEWGLAAIAGQEAQFKADFNQALNYAVALGAKAIHVMAGVIQDPSDRRQALRVYVDNLRSVAKSAAAHGITLLLEPLNTRDKPGYLVSRSDEIAEILAEIAEPNVKLLFDIYHVQIMEGDLTRRIERHAPLIGHVQLASVPDRWEPDLGEVQLGHVLAALDRAGYAGLIGLEYRPRGDTAAGLSWIDRLEAAN